MKDKLTSNAQAVLEVVRTANNHPTALEIYETVREQRPRIGVATVYRILHNLVEQGHVKEINTSEESCRYDGRISRHDHAICTVCGALIDVPVDVKVSEAILQAAAQASGITLSSHEVRLYGLCPSCQAKHK
ncbi:transcriptional repressor [Ktedonosporobacter rubrisoli]|uniref:Transcriptional repressor n=1 Tax=Ktedonosporobacter rubrisoli TaxID=2509675 RepID=A0A4P6K1R6_KTERU|nr:Fur family transcriptional regulator [Ktedonosporobacter rubrisoli]QBD81620.1 transcriptional repressor [Ktedonosporobacter rubrisoli]